jgi:hypothetical protein
MVAPLIIAAGIGAGLGATGNIWGGINARNDLRYQATTLNSQARLEEEAAAFNALQTARQFDQLMGEQRQSVASSGTETEGSVLEIFNKTMQDKKTSTEYILAEGRRKAEALRSQARQARKAGNRSLIGGFLSGASSGLSSAASISTKS